ncbi:hypothetical protein [Sphaerisporangium corydalis]|uniref:Type I-B CRISPR-associated protein Cas8b1/Cst1 n=1 Tax=Sphaerisporangium corydalis TaxID=1441875 RepID=A0ABV9EJR3_9ACTN|nr:hypothetical protein [Sphaerisporangium corydalis]
MTAEVLDAVAARIASDVARAAVAAQGMAEYDWWKVLFALYPNSPPTHAKRQRDRELIRAEMVKLLARDTGVGEMRPCVFCGLASSILWAKSLMPMFDTVRALNTLPPGVAGWPVCWACRVSLWALPYGAWLTAGSATVLTCDDPLIEWEFVRENVSRAVRIVQTGFASLPAGAGPEAVVVEALRDHSRRGDAAPSGGRAGPAAAATLWMFKNDNQEPWLRVSSTRVGVGRFLRMMQAASDAREGFRQLRTVLVRRDRSGAVQLDGHTAVARLLFDPDRYPADRLLGELYRRLRTPDELPQLVIRRWCVLSRLYLEVMHEMDVTRYAPVADIFVRWIGQDSTRGRFNEFRSALGSGWQLHRLFVNASARLFLDGSVPASVRDGLDAKLVSSLFEQGEWRGRAGLYTVVLSELIKSGVRVGKSDDDTDDQDDDESVEFDPERGEAEEEEYG